MKITKIVEMFLLLGLFVLTDSPVASAQSRGDDNRADPCTLVPDNAQGLQDHRCRFGRGSGIARGDFNGDGIADLVIGIPNETRTNLRFSGSLSTGFISTQETNAGAVGILLGSSTGLTNSGALLMDQTVFQVSQNAHFGTAVVPGKFHDISSPYSDLAVGAPGVPKPGTSKFGAVYVFNNNNGTLTTNSVGTVLYAADANVPPFLSMFGVVFPSDMTMTWGDFNGDGFGDLAVEARSSDCATCTSAVVVYFGSGNGLSSTNNITLDLDDGFSPHNFNNGTTCLGTTFGTHFCAKSRGPVSLAAVDLNGDGMDELLIGAPGCIQITDSGTTVSGDFNEGCVAIVPGRSDGPNQFFGWSVMLGDRTVGFGSSLAVGDFDGDGFKDIAVGEPGSTPGVSGFVAGAVRVYSHPQLHGVLDPIDKTDSTLINQSTVGIGGLQSDGEFGGTLAANDFNGDAVTDLAIGAPGETVSGLADTGEVYIVYGQSGAGLSTASGTNHPAAQVFAGPFGGRAGDSLSAWNFGKSSQADLAIGSPVLNVTLRILNFNGGFSFETINGAGEVNVLYGSSSGLNLISPQTWLELNLPGGGVHAGVHFGAAVY